MSNNSPGITRVRVEVQTDFVQRQARTAPLQAIAECVWNALDADATSVDIVLERNNLGLQHIIIRDTGTGMPYAEAADLFGKLGGSWKKLRGRTLKEGRALHGREGRGRFKVIVLGRVADWRITYQVGGEYRSYEISIIGDDLREVRITDERPASLQRTGVELVISEPHQDLRFLEGDDAHQALAEIFAPYLKSYNTSISLQGIKVDPRAAITKATPVNLADIVDGETAHPVRLEIIEWRRSTKRALYLCNERGFPLSQVDGRFHVGDHHFSAYLKSSFIEQQHDDNLLQMGEMNTLLNPAVEAARQSIKDHFRKQAADAARTVVEEWKAENSYPFQEAPKTAIEEAERQVFDIVAVTASRYVPDFSVSPPKNRAWQLRMLRQAIERSPQDLQLILKEVLDLPLRKQEELAKLLQEASLSAIIGAAKVVSDRLKFLSGLEAIVFDLDVSEHLKERTQLHRILADNTWVFGEEFNLMVDDRSLTECLRKHVQAHDRGIVIDKPVRHPSKVRGIVDLMLSKVRRLHRASDVEHLVVELKAPKVPIGRKEILQVEEYVQAVTTDSRFDSSLTRWSFWALSRDVDEAVVDQRQVEGMPAGVVLKRKNVTVVVKTWGQVIADNKARLQFFQESLEHRIDKGTALRHLRERYDAVLSSTLTDEVVTAAEEADAVEEIGAEEA